MALAYMAIKNFCTPPSEEAISKSFACLQSSARARSPRVHRAIFRVASRAAENLRRAARMFRGLRVRGFARSVRRCGAGAPPVGARK